MGWSGVDGSVLLALYFGIPTVVPRLRDLLYSSDNPSTAHVVSVGADYHVLLGAGSWLQGMGAFIILAGVQAQPRQVLAKGGIVDTPGKIMLCDSVDEAVKIARERSMESVPPPDPSTPAPPATEAPEAAAAPR